MISYAAQLRCAATHQAHMSNQKNDHDIFNKVASLVVQLHQNVNDPVRLRSIARQASLVSKSFRDALAQPPRANDHLTEDQVTDAVRVCDDLVAAHIIGEDPASIDWSNLDSCNALARKVIGQERVLALYKMHRPEQLPGYIEDEASGFAAIR
jgi:hypothetical protein